MTCRVDGSGGGGSVGAWSLVGRLEWWETGWWQYGGVVEGASGIGYGGVGVNRGAPSVRLPRDLTPSSLSLSLSLSLSDLHTILRLRDFLK